MPLPAAVEKLDAIPEAHRSLYKQDGSRFVLDVEGAEDVFAAGLKKNRDEILTDRKKLAAKLDELKDVDPEEYRKLKAATAEAEEKKAKDAGQFDTLKQQLIEKHNGDLKKVQLELDTDRAFIREVLADSVATKELAAAGGNAKLLLPHVLKQIDVVRGDDGKYSAVVKDAKGNVRIGNAQGAPMTIAELVAEFKASEDYAAAFSGSGASGSGAAGSSTAAGAAGTVRSRKDFKTTADKVAFIEKHGREAFEKLPAQ